MNKEQTKKVANEIKKVIVSNDVTYDDALFCLGMVETELHKIAATKLNKISVARILKDDLYE